MDDWKAATRRGDIDAMIRLLEQIEISQPQVVVYAILANPEPYGFTDHEFAWRKHQENK